MNRARDEQPPEETAAGPAGLFGALHGVEERDPKMLANVLYVAAWAVEVLAVTAGLVISVMIALDAFHQVEESKGRVTTSDYIDMVAATIPFILVAIVEATKIPVAGAAYTARTWGWRVVFTATLFFLALVTFETMLNGFERNFSNLTYVVSGLQKEKIAVEEKLELLEDQRTEAASLTAEGIESRYTARRNDLVADRDQNVARVQSKISELKGSIEDDSIRALQDELDHLREQREMLSTRREQEVSRLNRRMDERISGRREELAQERALLAEQLRNADALLSEKIKQKESAVADATIFTRGGVVERFDQDITRLREDRDRFQAQLEALGGQGDDEEIRRIQKQVERTNQKFDADARALTSKLERKENQIRNALGLKQAGLKPLLDGHYEELDRIQAKFEQQQQLNSDERGRKLEDLEVRAARIGSLSEQIDDRRAKLAELRDKINRQVSTNQVYRLAVRFSDAESAADLKPSTVTWVAGIWFGSLAAVVAFTGILLALASYVIRDTSPRPETTLRDPVRKLINSCRRAVIEVRRRTQRPKIEKVFIDREVPREIVKEVPVQKVAIREVPKEIILKEIVHVPMYTNDPALLDPPRAAERDEPQ